MMLLTPMRLGLSFSLFLLFRFASHVLLFDLALYCMYIVQFCGVVGRPCAVGEQRKPVLANLCRL